jgi:glycosyltransferase involved in cell wall biosynthesis
VAGLALVIPAWNEAESISAVLSEVPHDVFDQVLVVVGSDADPTAAVARAGGARVLAQVGRGYGSACATGAAAALADGARIIAFIDGDYADPPSGLPRVLEPVVAGRADLVLGCRDLREHPDALPAHARLGNAAVLALIRLLTRRAFGDLPSCKAIGAEAFRRMRMSEPTYGWTVEMLVKSARLGLRIEESWLEYRPRLGGRSKVAGSARGSAAAAASLIVSAIKHARWQPNV